jgi:hypothetical protein
MHRGSHGTDPQKNALKDVGVAGEVLSLQQI